MSVSPTLVGRTDELKKTYRLAPESGQSALRVANVAIQIVKSMNPLYADAKHNERLELVSEYKLANRIPRSTSESIEMVYPGSGSIHQQKSRERSHPDDVKVVIACVELCREIGNPSARGISKVPNSRTSIAMRLLHPGIKRVLPRWDGMQCRS